MSIPHSSEDVTMDLIDFTDDLSSNESLRSMPEDDQAQIPNMLVGEQVDWSPTTAFRYPNRFLDHLLNPIPSKAVPTKYSLAGVLNPAPSAVSSPRLLPIGPSTPADNHLAALDTPDSPLGPIALPPIHVMYPNHPDELHHSLYTFVSSSTRPILPPVSVLFHALAAQAPEHSALHVSQRIKHSTVYTSRDCFPSIRRKHATRRQHLSTYPALPIPGPLEPSGDPFLSRSSSSSSASASSSTTFGPVFPSTFALRPLPTGLKRPLAHRPARTHRRTFLGEVKSPKVLPGKLRTKTLPASHARDSDTERMVHFAPDVKMRDGEGVYDDEDEEEEEEEEMQIDDHVETAPTHQTWADAALAFADAAFAKGGEADAGQVPKCRTADATILHAPTPRLWTVTANAWASQASEWTSDAAHLQHEQPRPTPHYELAAPALYIGTPRSSVHVSPSAVQCAASQSVAGHSEWTPDAGHQYEQPRPIPHYESMAPVRYIETPPSSVHASPSAVRGASLFAQPLATQPLSPRARSGLAEFRFPATFPRALADEQAQNHPPSTQTQPHARRVATPGPAHTLLGFCCWERAGQSHMALTHRCTPRRLRTQSPHSACGPHRRIPSLRCGLCEACAGRRRRLRGTGKRGHHGYGAGLGLAADADADV
ncbi:hypothetical protein C8R43DRAFT_607539 [Mycena crocata]|nr:hypothetical protein C8R43DRAFT_607539 [Mycena crocata]